MALAQQKSSNPRKLKQQTGAVQHGVPEPHHTITDNAETFGNPAQAGKKRKKQKSATAVKSIDAKLEFQGSKHKHKTQEAMALLGFAAGLPTVKHKKKTK